MSTKRIIPVRPQQDRAVPEGEGGGVVNPLCTDEEEGRGLLLVASGGGYWTWEALWQELCVHPDDYLAKYFPFVAYNTRVICNPALIAVSLVSGIYCAATEIASCYVPQWNYGSYGWATGGSALALVVALVVIPAAIKGSTFSGKLLQDSDNSRSFYETLDVMIKDLSPFDDKGPRRRSCQCLSNAQRTQQLQRVQAALRGPAIFTVLLTLCFSANGFLDVCLSVRDVMLPPDRQFRAAGKRWFTLLAVPEFIMFTVAALSVGTAVQLMCTGACLHRAHTNTFLTWLATFRTATRQHPPPGIAAAPSKLCRVNEEEEAASYDDDGAGWCCSSSPCLPLRYLPQPQQQAVVDGSSTKKATANDDSDSDSDDDGDDDDKKMMDHEAFHRVGEAYLLMQKLFMRSSESWSVTLTAWIFSTGTLFVFCAIASVVVKDAVSQSSCIVLSFANFCVCIIPIIILAYANGFVELVIATIAHSKWSDFGLIGGRERWSEYIKSYPCYWYIFGFAITKSWLLGFLSGAISTFGLLFINQLAGGGA